MLREALSSLVRLGRDLAAAKPAGCRDALREARSLRSMSQMQSWVVLCGSFFHAEARDVLQALEDAFPGHFLAPRDGGGFVVGGPSPEPLLIQSRVPGASGTFMLLSADGRYVSEERLAIIADPALRDRARAQQGWFSIDLIQGHDDGGNAYAFIGPALARLAPHDAAVLTHPTAPVLAAFTPSIRQRLAAGVSPDELEEPS